eukprot:gnl/TRDRNA2_/TRDRNA2_134915_c0_seq3.p1 gnl/TRDRNA2_/TRDRNA2_134915_c0~~gnl/TRDRNA2_/TRDRNA2_134915_c0_seq3.p1  ORF type:complete len:318 (+),score=50.82 gnl/TRDRNA2_/TRDRNA2_134915_c0_seq3:140-1093(+)
MANCPGAGRTAADEPHGGNWRLRVIEPLLIDMFGSATTPAAIEDRGQAVSSHRTASLRIFFDIICAIEPAERAVPPWVLTGLVDAGGPPWDAGPQGEELRAVLLLLLLQTPSNCEAAAASPEVCLYLRQPGFKRKDDTFWPVKAYLLSGETPDLIRKCARLVARRCPGADVELPPRRARDTPSLQLKRDIRNFQTTALLTAGWASFRAWRGVISFAAAMTIGRAAGCALGGVAVLEGLWRAQEHMIQSEWYYHQSHVMLPCSAAMCLVNCTAWAWFFRYSVAVPFAFCRFVKDDALDAYRNFESSMPSSQQVEQPKA